MYVHPRITVAAASAAAIALVTVVVATAAIAPPPSIASAGRIVFCSDLGYPPMESLQGSRPVGGDIDIGSAIGKSMGVKAQFRNVGFDGIIAALLAKKCDAILSGMTDTAQRRRQVDFTDYLMVGMSLMVKKAWGALTRVRAENSVLRRTAEVDLERAWEPAPPVAVPAICDEPRECPTLCVGMTEKERHVYEGQDRDRPDR
jgi:ABC-type amino acid transport substrate-binding protein